MFYKEKIREGFTKCPTKGKAVVSDLSLVPNKQEQENVTLNNKNGQNVF